MRHKRARLWISDDLDGVLSPEKKNRLETHLAACPSCRAYRSGLARIQSCSAAAISVRTDEEREAGLARLRKNLDLILPGSKEKGNPARPVPGFFPWRPLAWAAGTAVLGIVFIVFILGKPVRLLQEAYAYSFGDSWNSFENQLDADESIVREVDDLIRSDMAESLADVQPEVISFMDEHALFLESLSDADIRLLNSEIALEITEEES